MNSGNSSSRIIQNKSVATYIDDIPRKRNQFWMDRYQFSWWPWRCSTNRYLITELSNFMIKLNLLALNYANWKFKPTISSIATFVGYEDDSINGDQVRVKKWSKLPPTSCLFLQNETWYFQLSWYNVRENTSPCISRCNIYCQKTLGQSWAFGKFIFICLVWIQCHSRGLRSWSDLCYWFRWRRRKFLIIFINDFNWKCNSADWKTKRHK